MNEKSDETLRIGIDIGSTATKVALIGEEGLQETFLCPTGFSSIDAAQRVASELALRGYEIEKSRSVATGYGRVAVSWADRVVTEITCHARGAWFLFEEEGTVIDIGGQDIKVISVKEGKVIDFLMNDKCSAGTGKFLEIMANRLNVNHDELSDLAQKGRPTTITSMCTVFAESEVVSLIGKGTPRADIAYGVIESIVARVAGMATRTPSERFFLTGGLCDNQYVVERLQSHVGEQVITQPLARYAGAIGAALSA